jgi:hypothetical protein
MVLVGLNFFVFSMGELWGKGSERRLFEQHVRSVTRYVERELRVAAYPPAQAANKSAFSIDETKVNGALSENLISYDLLESSRLLSWVDRPLPEVRCSLLVREGKGLFILYHSRLETKFDDDAPREVLVSPFITAISYAYYDSDLKRWTTEKSFKKDNANTWMVPQRIILTFKYKTLTQDILIAMPAAVEGLNRL